MENMGQLKVSVLMLTYNRENLIERAIKSVLKQTFKDFEFIVIDNGSEDRSGKIADAYANTDKRMHVIHRPKATISCGRNQALDVARGQYIAFIDDDDWLEADFLEFLLNLIETHHADMSICGAADKAFDEKKVMSASEALIELMERKRYNVAFPTKMFRRDLMRDLRFPEDKKFDDIALMYRLIASCDKVVYHGLPKYTFYRHPGNNSAWTTNYALLDAQTLEEYLAAYRTRTEWLSEKFPEQRSDFEYFEWSFMVSMVEKITRYNISDCAQIRGALCEVLSRNQEKFFNSARITDFEKEWMRKYVLT